MGLMFQRLARNFIVNGYFPTDSDTTERVLNALRPSGTTMRVIDPCCGEGVALAECCSALGSDAVGYGIEFDKERAWHAKSMPGLRACLHGDSAETLVSQRSMGLLWLNPPYGNAIGDMAASGEVDPRSRRLEWQHYYRAFHYLQYEGVMVLILPSSSFDKAISAHIARYFDRVAVYQAPTQQFKQVVLLGVRRRGDSIDEAVRDRLIGIGKGEIVPDTLPVDWVHKPYTVPSAPSGEFRFEAFSLNDVQLADEISRAPCLWPQFGSYFAQRHQVVKPPATSLSRWHLALTLAAGQIEGIVSSRAGKQYLVKGGTHKGVKETRRFEEAVDDKASDGREVIERRDTFESVIRALDVTPGSAEFGRIITIK